MMFSAAFLRISCLHKATLEPPRICLQSSTGSHAFPGSLLHMLLGRFLSSQMYILFNLTRNVKYNVINAHEVQAITDVIKSVADLTNN